MEELKLGMKVVVIGCQRQGKIRAVWTQLDSPTSYQVRYFDANSRVVDEWFEASELKAEEESGERGS